MSQNPDNPFSPPSPPNADSIYPPDVMARQAAIVASEAKSARFTVLN